MLESIVDELSNNAIEHGHPTDKKFCITFSFDKRHARLAVTNSCPELSPEEQEKYGTSSAIRVWNRTHSAAGE